MRFRLDAHGTHWVSVPEEPCFTAVHAHALAVTMMKSQPSVVEWAAGLTEEQTPYVRFRLAAGVPPEAARGVVAEAAKAMAQALEAGATRLGVPLPPLAW